MRVANEKLKTKYGLGYRANVLFKKIDGMCPVGAYCIRPNMYPAVYMADILYQQKLFITQ